jgi:hypothetical protein
MHDWKERFLYCFTIARQVIIRRGDREYVKSEEESYTKRVEGTGDGCEVIMVYLTSVPFPNSILNDVDS